MPRRNFPGLEGTFICKLVGLASSWHLQKGRKGGREGRKDEMLLDAEAGFYPEADTFIEISIYSHFGVILGLVTRVSII